MRPHITIIGSGVAGLTCGVVLARSGAYDVRIVAKEIPGPTSAAAAAIWFPYHIEPERRVTPWSLKTRERLRELMSFPDAGITEVEFRVLSRIGPPVPPACIASECELLDKPHGFRFGYSVRVHVIDSTKYLPWLQEQFLVAGGSFDPPRELDASALRALASTSSMIVNCSGVGARELWNDDGVKLGRGVVAVWRGSYPHAVVCADEASELMYLVPREDNCVIGGFDIEVEAEQPDATRDEVRTIVERCARDLAIDVKVDEVEPRVGHRPERCEVCLEPGEPIDGCPVVHNYGHGGAGFTVSWGCAEEVASIVRHITA